MKPLSPIKQRRRISWNSLSTVLRKTLSLAGLTLVNGITLPYYRFYRQNTLLPIQSIAKSVQAAESVDVIAEKLKRWRDRKLHEFQFVQVAATLLAAAVIGCFSWSPQIEQKQHWLGPAAWYCSLVLSITAVLLSSSEAFIFSAIKNAPPAPSPSPIITHQTRDVPCTADLEEPGPTRAPTQQVPVMLSQRLNQELSMILHVQFEPTNSPHDLRESGPTTNITTTDDNTTSSPGSPLPATTRTRTRTSTTLRGDPEGDIPTQVQSESTIRNRSTNRRSDPESQEQEEDEASPTSNGPAIKVNIRWNMVFTWQAPIMLMGYSVVAFYLGLVVYVSAPLYDGHEGEYFNGPGKAAIFFLVWSGLSGGIFVWCSYWAYRFVELDGL